MPVHLHFGVIFSNCIQIFHKCFAKAVCCDLGKYMLNCVHLDVVLCELTDGLGWQLHSTFYHFFLLLPMDCASSLWHHKGPRVEI